MTYPLRFPDADPRFSPALISEVAEVLAANGFPPITDDTRDSLRAALLAFLYGTAYRTGDKVTWVTDGKVWSGTVEHVANTDAGQVARIKAQPQPGDMYYSNKVIACRDLTLVPDGAS